MRILVTGAAGFIGSHVCERLAAEGHDVWGVDSFEPYYDRAVKERNLAFSSTAPPWAFEERSVGSLGADELRGVDVVVHLAAQPGVRDSWDRFDAYASLNLVETNSLAAALGRARVPRVVFASSSSVYGNAATYPTTEGDPLLPRSPYGVTKQAAEALWRAHSWGADVSVLALRLFTVYGPGQRPDMAIQRMIRASLDGVDFPLYGTGTQRRDFTFISDVEEAVRRACLVEAAPGFTAINVGGSGDTSMLDLIATVERVTCRQLRLDRRPMQRGDAERTGADVSLAAELLGWAPAVMLAEGVARQVQFELDPSATNWSSGAVATSVADPL